MRATFCQKKIIAIFFPLSDDEGIITVADNLLINVRLGDVGRPLHPLYGPLPISYHRYLIEKTGLQPVFIGELDNSAYCAARRFAFPMAVFLVHRTVRNDFEIIRRARNIGLPISTFSWVASYLSEASTIHLPVCGLYDLGEQPQFDMLPTDDPRFTFHKISADVWSNRYADFVAEQSHYRAFRRDDLRRMRRVANFRSTLPRLRVLWGMHRRLALRARSIDQAEPDLNLLARCHCP